MRIAFVGKGGSGKTTITALFTQFLKKRLKNIISIDADINLHLPELLLGEDFPKDKFLSSPSSSEKIKKYLAGGRDIGKSETFRKTTPPSIESNLVYVDNPEDSLIKEFAVKKGDVNVMAVGTYESEGIGTSCYHNNLAVLENVLTHMVDKDGVVVADMVAGTDAFASSLHVQFDAIVLVIEPTKRGAEVLRKYLELGKSAGIDEDVFVVGNKISSEEDKDFLTENASGNRLLGFISNSDYVKEHDKNGGVIELDKLEHHNQETIKKIFEKLIDRVKEPNERLKKIHALHKKYVSQSFIKDRFGDLTSQIDSEFKF